MKYKIERIKQMLKKEVMQTIAAGIVQDPRIPVVMTITRITVSKDIHYCHIYFTCYGDDGVRRRAVEGLNSSAGVFQRQIARNLKLRFTPVIEFRYDSEEEKALEVDKILYQVAQEHGGDDKPDQANTSGLTDEDFDCMVDEIVTNHPGLV